MASEIPLCSLFSENSAGNNLGPSIFGSNVFASAEKNEFENPNSKVRNLDKSGDDICDAKKQDYGIGGIALGGIFDLLGDRDFEVFEAGWFGGDVGIEGSVLNGNWKDKEDFVVYCVGREIDVDLNTAIWAVADWLGDLQVDPKGLDTPIERDTGYLREVDQEVKKGNGMLDRGISEKDPLITGFNYLWNPTGAVQAEHKTIPYKDIRYKAMPFCPNHRGSGNFSGFIEKKEAADVQYVEPLLPSWEAAHFSSGVQRITQEAELPKEWDGCMDFWRGSPTKMAFETRKSSIQLDLEDFSTRTAYYDCSRSPFGKEGTSSALLQDSSYEEASEGAPHDALFFTLSYLSLQDLLSVERVCKSLRAAVKNDVLLWRSIHVEHPLCERLTDDALLQLSARAQGHLQCLSLVGCMKITDDGLKRVLDISPKLTKLCLPGCTRLTAEGIVRNVKAHRERKDVSFPGLKQLRIGGLYGVTREHLEKLKFLLDGGLQQKSVKPQFYHSGHYSLSYDDDRAIDIEVCPKCGNPRLVYDCTMERCRQREDSTLRECRGCTFCIARCDECGRCIDDTEYEETFCLDSLCSDCCLQFLNCQQQLHRPSCSKHSSLIQEARYHFCLW